MRRQTTPARREIRRPHKLASERRQWIGSGRALDRDRNEQPHAPASLVAKAATSSDGGAPLLLHGYYFRLLPKGVTNGTPGGFALIAYPAEYRSSGVMTFIVTKNGLVYEKDLGANTPALASAIAAFHKNATWRPANE